MQRDYVTGADAVEIWMKGRIIIQVMNGIQYANDMPLAVVEYENKLYECRVYS